MRKVFMEELTLLAEKDPSLYFITGDLGYSFVEDFAKRFPTRFINAGVAEQNMISMAAGLAMAGKRVFAYSIVPFVTLRPYEQVKIDLCYHNVPVTLVGVGGGFGYGAEAATHHSIEDVAAMRALPNMTVLAPANGHEIKALMPEIGALKGPAYLRLAKVKDSGCTHYPAPVRLGTISPVVSTKKHILLTSGHMLDEGLKVSRLLEERGIMLGVYSVHTVKPLDLQFFTALDEETESLFTLEEHSVIGGLGEAVSRAVCENVSHKVSFKAFGINDRYEYIAGDAQFLREHSLLGAEKVAQEIVKILEVSEQRLSREKGIFSIREM